MKASTKILQINLVLLNDTGKAFQNKVGVRQGCLLSPVLFNIFLERITQEALANHNTSISIGGHKICNLRFADDIDLMAGTQQELQDLTNRLETSATRFGMEISAEKSKVLVNGPEGRSGVIMMNGDPLEEVEKFKYLGAYLTKNGTSQTELRTRIATATTAMVKLEHIWKSTNISFKTKHRLYQSLVVSIFLYGCEAWTITAADEKKIIAFENKQHRKLLGITWRERKTNEFVKDQIRRLIGVQEPLLATVKRRKLTYFGHSMRHQSLNKTIIQGTIEGGRKRGRPKKNWLGNILEWTGMDLSGVLTVTQDRERWRRIAAEVALQSPLRPPRSRD